MHFICVGLERSQLTAPDALALKIDPIALTDRQGDQIGRVFVLWVVVNFGHFLKINKGTFFATFSRG
jgi:hypothetical protein